MSLTSSATNLALGWASPRLYLPSLKGSPAPGSQTDEGGGEESLPEQVNSLNACHQMTSL